MAMSPNIYIPIRAVLFTIFLALSACRSKRHEKKAEQHHQETNIQPEEPVQSRAGNI
jgi:hypothetical protein